LNGNLDGKSRFRVHFRLPFVMFSLHDKLFILSIITDL